MNADTIRTILYVEDNPVNLHLVKAIFAARADIKLLAALDGTTGLTLAEQHRPGLILLDLHLPDMSGEDFLARLRKIGPIAKTPVIVLTGDVFPEDRKKFLALGVADYVTKPLDIAEFENAVEACLREAPG